MARLGFWGQEASKSWGSKQSVKVIFLRVQQFDIHLNDFLHNIKVTWNLYLPKIEISRNNKSMLMKSVKWQSQTSVVQANSNPWGYRWFLFQSYINKAVFCSSISPGLHLRYWVSVFVSLTLCFSLPRSFWLISRNSEKTTRTAGHLRKVIMVNIYFSHKACNGAMEILEKAAVQIKVQILESLGYEKGTESSSLSWRIAINFGRALLLFKRERRMC